MGPRLLVQGAHALWHEGDLRTARACFESAYRSAERDGDPRVLGEAALGLAGLGVHEFDGFVHAAVVLDRLRRAARTAPPDSRLGLRLRTRLAAESDYASASHGTALAMVAQARRAGDPVPLAEALNLALHCLLGPVHRSLRRRAVEELAVAGARSPRPVDRLLGRLWRVVDLVLDGAPDAPERLAELNAELAEGGHGAIGHVARAIEVMFDVRAGRFEPAELAAKECAEAGASAGHPAAPAWYAAHLVAIRWYQGRLPELLPLLEEAVALPSLSPTDYSFQSALALTSATAGDTRRARAALAGLTAHPLAELPRSGAWLATLYQVVEAAHSLGDPEAAAEAYALLRPCAGRTATIAPGIACFGSVEHALGLAKLTVGQLDAAVGHLRHAVRENLALGHWPATILARHRLAQALAHAGDRHGARREAETARHDAADLGVHLPSADRPATASAPSCRRDGRVWRVEADGRTAVVEHSRGIAYLAVLLANPGREIRAVDLPAIVAGAPPVDATPPPVGEPLATQSLLDGAAIRQYRHRLAALEREAQDPQTRAERDWLREQLRSATGLGGRARHFPSVDERARIAVGKAIRRALRRVAGADAELGRALAATVRTGQHCAYVPGR